MSLKHSCQEVTMLKAIGNIKDKTLKFVEVGATPKLIDVIKTRPELVKLMKSAIIQAVTIEAENGKATRISVKYIPKGAK